MHRITTLAPLLLPVLLAGSGRAVESCPPLQVSASVSMEPGFDDRPYVPVRVDGTPEYMLVDTGAAFTGVTESISRQLKLVSRQTRLKFVGVSGKETSTLAHGALTLGNLYARGMDFMLMEPLRPLPNGSELAGLIGGNILRAYDVEFDFGNRKVNLLSQDHCEGRVIYWPSDRIAVVPMQINTAGHIIVPVDLDGHRLTALLDTGSNVSVLNMERAEATFGLKPGSADTPAVGELSNAAGVKLYSHRFGSLSLDGIAVSNPNMTIVPDLLRGKLHNPRDSLEGDTRIGNPNDEIGMSDVILGTDILHHLHLYIAYRERKLYISSAQSGASSVSVSGSPSTRSSSAIAMQRWQFQR